MNCSLKAVLSSGIMGIQALLLAPRIAGTRGLHPRWGSATGLNRQQPADQGLDCTKPRGQSLPWTPLSTHHCYSEEELELLGKWVGQVTLSECEIFIPVFCCWLHQMRLTIDPVN